MTKLKVATQVLLTFMGIVSGSSINVEIKTSKNKSSTQRGSECVSGKARGRRNTTLSFHSLDLPWKTQSSFLLLAPRYLKLLTNCSSCSPFCFAVITGLNHDLRLVSADLSLIWMGFVSLLVMFAADVYHDPIDVVTNGNGRWMIVKSFSHPIFQDYDK